MSEEWRPVVGFEGLYEVSDLGRVRSLDRVVATGCRWGGRIARTYRGRVLSPTVAKGYAHLTLYDGGRKRHVEVQVLVAEAFLGPRPEGREVCHGNGLGLDNRAQNLRYGTSQDNHDDKRRHGTNPAGERHGLAKLTDADVRLIRRRRGERLAEIAEDLGVSRSLVSLVQRGERWQHVE